MNNQDAQFRRQEIMRRVIYLLVAAAVSIPFVFPLPLPCGISPQAQKVYDKVEALKPGSPILLSLDFDPASMAELKPMSLALLTHCFRRGLRPIVMTHWPNGVDLCKEMVEKAAKEAGNMFGKDYAFLGFKPGTVNLILNMGENLKSAFEKDFYGVPTESMASLEGVRSLKILPLVVCIAAGDTMSWWIAYGRDRFGFDLGGGCTAVSAPGLYPYLQSGQLIGLLGGLRGAADYEKMIEKPAAATKGMQSQTFAHILIIVLILGANFHYLSRRFFGSKEA